MSSISTSKTDLIKSLKGELLKEYVVYDGFFRKEYVYQASSGASTDDPCLVTQFAYDGTSARVTKRKESVGSWDSSWDI